MLNCIQKCFDVKSKKCEKFEVRSNFNLTDPVTVKQSGRITTANQPRDINKTEMILLTTQDTG
jgi:hypothetical protein